LERLPEYVVPSVLKWGGERKRERENIVTVAVESTSAVL
jgi:hypothetical protein